MAAHLSDSFLQNLNPNLGIAHKVSRAYFQDVDDRADVLQEMMYQLWRSYPGFDNRAKFSTWMYRVCLNTAFTYRRKNKKEGKESLALKHDEIADHVEANQEEIITELFSAIADLSPVNKAVVLLYLENMSYEEISAVTGLTKTNVSVKLVRIKKELETKLKSKI